MRFFFENEVIMKVKKIDNFKINKDNEVTVTVSGNTTQIRAMSQKTLPHTKKLSRDEYMVLSTGEVKDIDHSNTRRIDNEISVKQTFSRLRDRINANVINPTHCKFVTLTYKDNMTDNKHLKADLKKYYLRFNYYCKKRNIKPPEYITVIEPQGRGAFHAHIIYIFSKKAPYISNDDLLKLWRHGFVNIKNIDDEVNNVGAYLTAYLTDMCLDDVKDIRQLKNIKETDIKTIDVVDENGNKVSKTFIKFLRLQNFPKGMRIYRCSKGVKKPVRYNCRYGEALEQVKDHELVYEKSIALIDEDGTEKTKINYQHYNKVKQSPKSKKG